MNRLPWIKLDTDFFNNPKIRLVLSASKGERSIVTYWRLYCEAGAANIGGLIGLDENRPLSIDELSTILNIPKQRLKEDVEVLTKYELLGIAGEGFYIVNWDVEQAADKLAKRRANDCERSKRYRERNKTDSKKDSDSEKDKEEDKEASREHHVTECFNLMYNLYPIKSKKAESFEYLKTVNHTEEELQDIYDIMTMQVETWKIANYEYIPNILNYLKDEMWKSKEYLDLKDPRGRAIVVENPKLNRLRKQREESITATQLRELSEYLFNKIYTFEPGMMQPDFDRWDKTMKEIVINFGFPDEVRKAIDSLIGESNRNRIKDVYSLNSLCYSHQSTLFRNNPAVSSIIMARYSNEE